MNKYLRMFLILILIVGIIALAKNNVAWAGPASESKQPAPVTGNEHSQPGVKPDPGSVKPPPAEVTICKKGTYSVGGQAILMVNRLEPDYCLEASLRNHAFAIGRIPDGAGKVLADVTFLRAFYQGRFIHAVPAADGDIEICYAVPLGVQAQIYFFNFYGPRFDTRTGQPAWVPLDTTVTGGTACAQAQTSGAYALIGK